MKGFPKRHSKYSHVYAIVRFDLPISSESCATVVKVLALRELAEQVAARLREVQRTKYCIYVLQMTRFIGATLMAES